MGINRDTNNFDFLRLVLAVIVAIAHTAILSGAGATNTISQFISSEVAVDAFFVISGFLIFMSYESSKSLLIYARKRVRRIFPGYLSVIILCSIFFYFISSKPVLDYFNTDLLKYIIYNGLTLNFLHPNLPGVFEGNTLQAVNGALWTIKIEVLFYATVPLISILISKFIKHRLLILFAIYALSVSYSYLMLRLATHYDMAIFIQLERQLPGQLAFFISGALIYYYYDFFCKRATALIITAGIIMAVHANLVELNTFYPVSLAVIILYIANIFKYMGNWGRFGDLSFGVYIWHFPIIQVFVHFNLLSDPLTGYTLLVVSIFFAAYLSWHLIEKRFLHKSSHYLASEEKSAA